MGFVNEPLRLVKKTEKKRLFKIKLKVDKDNVSKMGNINIINDKGKVLKNNETVIRNVASSLANEMVYKNINEGDSIEKAVKNEELNKTNCLNPPQLLFNSALGYMTKGIWGALLPTISCLGNKYFEKLNKK